MSDDKKLLTAAGYSSLWDGQPIRRVRAGDGASVLVGRRVTMHLMAQPGVMNEMLSDRVLIDQGLLSRMLVVAPESAVGTRMFRVPSCERDIALRRFQGRILEVLEEPLPVLSDRQNELQPRAIPLSADAKILWIGFADHIETLMAPERQLVPIRGLANKLPEHAARLACVLALVEDLSVIEVGTRHMRAGIILAQHYASEGLRLFDAGRISAELVLARKTEAWLNSWTDDAISLADIYQRGPNAIRDKAKAAQVVKILEDHGRLVRLSGGATINGQRRRDAWTINREGL